MRKWVILIGLSIVVAAAQSLDLSSLEKIASKASDSNEINLNASQIRAALQFIPHNDKGDLDLDEDAKKLLSGLQTITVRNFEFEKPGTFQDADLEPIRSQLAKLKGWGKIVESKEKDEHSEVYMYTEDGKPTGIAVIDVEPKELSVVLVKSTSSLAQIGKLHGFMGLPNIKLGNQFRAPAKSSH